MHPDPINLNFLIFNLELRPYSFFISLAVLAVLAGSWWFAQRQGLPQKKIFFTSLLMALSGLAGARILHAFLNLASYQKDPTRWLALDYQGFSMYGGLVLAVMMAAILARAWKFDLWKFGDSVAPFLGIGIALARVGCFLNGCCFGRETDLPWGVTFPFMSFAHKYQILNDPASLFFVDKVHPTQLYEMIAALIGALIAIIMIRKKLTPGLAIIFFALWFTAFRFIDYFLMVRPASFTAPLYFYPFFYSILLGIGGVLLIWRLKNKN
jgi:phosphatidylglycerol---prolipoprotein diacylglyceryl transferase